MNLSSTTASTTSCLKNAFLSNLARSAGQSNSEILSRDVDTAIQDALPGIEEELGVLDEEIAILQAKRSKIAGLVQSLDVARAPHKRLPLDVLSHIFSMVAEGSKLSISRVRVYPPWVIRSVCSYWRKVALEHRTLWNAIILQPSPYIYGGEARVIDWDKKITRALSILPSETDVSISLRMNSGANYLVDKAFKKLILPLALHLRTLVLLGNGLRAFVNIFQMSSPTSFPALNTVKLILHNWGTEGPQELPWLGGGVSDNGTETETGSEASLLSSAPNLHSFDILWESTTGFQEFFQGLQSRICWGKLTHLQLKSNDYNPMDYDHLLPALTAATNLRRLSMNLDGGLDNLPQTLDMITLPHLQHLHVKSLTLPKIFDFLILPSLQHLIIDAVDDEVLQTIFAMITRSSTSFEERDTLGHNRRASTGFFTEFITRCGDLEELKTNREITADLLYKVAARELLSRCDFQRWTIPSNVSGEAVVSTIAEGLESEKSKERHLSFGHEKSKYWVLVLGNEKKEGEKIQSLISRFRSEYGLELRSHEGGLFSSDFINSSADEFDDDGLFRPDRDINFERDFGQWFNPTDANGLDMV